MRPRHYQSTAAARLAAQDVALLHGDMGIGKTLISLLGIKMAEADSALIICPAVAVSNWVREAAKIDIKAVALRTGSDRLLGGAEVVVVSYDLMTSPAIHHQLASVAWDVVIADEAHYLKSADAKRTQAFWGLGAYRGRGIAEVADHVWCLSGTPCPNNISELYPMLSAGMPSVVGKVTLDQFIQRYCRGYLTDYGFKIVGNKPDAKHILDRMGDRYLRIRKEDVLSELPPMQIETVVVEGAALAVSAIREIEETYRDQILAVLDGAPVSEHLATLARLTEMAKASAAADLALGLIEEGRKVFMVAKHRDTVDHLEHILGPAGVVAIHGGTSAKRRDEAIEEFTNGPAMVFVGQVQAAGTAITLHGGGKCQDVIAVSLDWVPANNAQAFARVHRIGQPGSVLVRVLALENSVDEMVTEALARKTRMLEEIYDVA
jgi:SWI/SNF-related matrix-associated actin-dependent regulator 1 of chromatin subfamily A